MLHISVNMEGMTLNFRSIQDAVTTKCVVPVTSGRPPEPIGSDLQFQPELAFSFWEPLFQTWLGNQVLQFPC